MGYFSAVGDVLTNSNKRKVSNDTSVAGAGTERGEMTGSVEVADVEERSLVLNDTSRTAELDDIEMMEKTNSLSFATSPRKGEELWAIARTKINTYLLLRKFGAKTSLEQIQNDKYTEDATASESDGELTVPLTTPDAHARFQALMCQKYKHQFKNAHCDARSAHHP